LNPNGTRDDAKGITTFIDGIGGEDGRNGSRISKAQSASAVYKETIGVIEFTLHPHLADFAMYDANTGTILDQGTIPCH
jgi:hypothetical protein